MNSKIYLSDVVENKEHKFGEARNYIPVMAVMRDGTEQPLLFTLNAIKVAAARAVGNPEDITESKKSFLRNLFT